MTEQDNNTSPTLFSSGTVGYDSVDGQYLEKRQLKQGAAGWILLAGLGVSYVISATLQAGILVSHKAGLVAC